MQRELIRLIADVKFLQSLTTTLMLLCLQRRLPTNVELLIWSVGSLALSQVERLPRISTLLSLLPVLSSLVPLCKSLLRSVSFALID